MAPNSSTVLADRLTERRRSVALARHYREYEGLSIREIADRLIGRRRRSRRTSTTRRGRRHGRSRPVTKACAVVAARTRSRATARATPTRTARPAIPARSSGAGPASGWSRRWPSGDRVTAGCRRPTTGRGRTRAARGRGAAALERELLAVGERRHGRVGELVGGARCDWCSAARGRAAVRCRRVTRSRRLGTERISVPNPR